MQNLCTYCFYFSLEKPGKNNTVDSFDICRACNPDNRLSLNANVRRDVMRKDYLTPFVLVKIKKKAKDNANKDNNENTKNQDIVNIKTDANYELNNES